MIPGMENDISMSTVLISSAVALASWALRGSFKLLISAIQMLVKKMIETISRVDLLDAKITDILRTIGDVEKSKRDINEGFVRIKKLEDDFRQFKQ